MFSFDSHLGWSMSAGPVWVGKGGVAQQKSTVAMRELRRKDGPHWRRLRLKDEAELRRVEPTATASWEDVHSARAWKANFANLKNLANTGVVVPMAILVDGEFVGQMTLGNIQPGSISSGWIGYWIGSAWSGRGVVTAALALAVDHAFGPLGLHRLEATVMEDNHASQAVLRKAGFRVEGLLKRNLHINGRWTDHILMAQTVEDVPYGGRVNDLASRGLIYTEA